jgi:hypothetical protein
MGAIATVVTGKVTRSVPGFSASATAVRWASCPRRSLQCPLRRGRARTQRVDIGDLGGGGLERMREEVVQICDALVVGHDRVAVGRDIPASP